MTAICDALRTKYTARKIQIEQTYLTVFGLKLLVTGQVQFIDGYLDIFWNLSKVNYKNWHLKMKFAGDLNRHICSLSFDLAERPLHYAASLLGVSKPVSWIPSFGS
jgi:hypothetical protein